MKKRLSIGATWRFPSHTKIIVWMQFILGGKSWMQWRSILKQHQEIHCKLIQIVPVCDENNGVDQ